MKLSDFKGLFKTSLLEIIEIDNPYGDYYTIKMSIPEGMFWNPGEHGIFTIPGTKIEGKKFRAFSLASITEEGYVLIGIRTGDNISSFKQNLLNLEKGDKIKIKGPFGWFKIYNDKPIVLIAGGVGITPIRGLVESIKHKNLKATIIYSSKDFYLFEDDLEKIVRSNDNINLIKTTNREDTTNNVHELSKELGNSGNYYISGSMTFINGIKKGLLEDKIKKGNIINDPFLGY